MYALETYVPNIGKIKAIKSGTPRDYLLQGNGVTTWLDELAIDKIMAEATPEEDI